MCNKTPEEASDLPKAEKFIKQHLGVTDLNNDCLRVLYQFAYVHLKYINRKVQLISESDMEIVKEAKADPWKFTMDRVHGDRMAGRDHDVIKDRLAALLRKAGFEPQ